MWKSKQPGFESSSSTVLLPSWSVLKLYHWGLVIEAFVIICFFFFFLGGPFASLLASIGL